MHAWCLINPWNGVEYFKLVIVLFLGGGESIKKEKGKTHLPGLTYIVRTYVRRAIAFNVSVSDDLRKGRKSQHWKLKSLLITWTEFKQTLPTCCTLEKAHNFFPAFYSSQTVWRESVCVCVKLISELQLLSPVLSLLERVFFLIKDFFFIALIFHRSWTRLAEGKLELVSREKKWVHVWIINLVVHIIILLFSSFWRISQDWCPQHLGLCRPLSQQQHEQCGRPTNARRATIWKLQGGEEFKQATQ